MSLNSSSKMGYLCVAKNENYNLVFIAGMTTEE
jgi:hypothetical protein